MDLSDDLQAKLAEYNRRFDALTTRFGEEAFLESSAVADLQVEQTKEMLANSLPTAVRTLVLLASNAGSESVRYKAATYIIDRTLGKDAALAEEDAATQLLRKLLPAAKVEED
jgi:hypothetical protein